MQVHGYMNGVSWSDPFYFYGSDALLLKQQINGSAGEWLSESLKIHKMQVRWAVQHEMARTVEDVLSRRTRALLLDAEESIRIAPQVARIMAEELDKNEEWMKDEVTGYTKLAHQYILNETEKNILA